MERMLITKLVRQGNRAELFAKGHQWPDLKLFDLSDLADVDIDYESLPEGQETPCRFWALYELSEKLNQAGNAYRDVVALEAIDKPATSSSADTSALLGELRAIRELLTAIAEAQGLDVRPAAPTFESVDAAFPRYGDGSPVSDIPAERESFAAYQTAEGHPPASVEALRAWYKTQNGH